MRERVFDAKKMLQRCWGAAIGDFAEASSRTPGASLEEPRLARASGGNEALTVMGGIPGRLIGVVRGTAFTGPAVRSCSEPRGALLGGLLSVLSLAATGTGALSREGNEESAVGCTDTSFRETALTFCASAAAGSPTMLGALSWTLKKPSPAGALPDGHDGALAIGFVGIRWR